MKGGRKSKPVRSAALPVADESGQTISRRQADKLDVEGFPALIKIFVALLAIGIAYFAATMGNDVRIVEMKDSESLREILASGHSWLVLCKSQGAEDQSLPVGLTSNLKSLGVTKTAIMDCNKALPQSGLSVAQKYKLNVKKVPTAFLSVGGTHTQIEPGLLTKEDDSLGQFVRKTVARRFSITDIKNSKQLRSYCAKHRCAIWPSGVKFFGPATASKYPKWVHVRVSESSLLVSGKMLRNVALVWATKSGDRFALFLGEEGSKFGSDPYAALGKFEEDPSFAEQKAIKLDFEWATEAKDKTASASSRTSRESSRERSRETRSRERPEAEKPGKENSEHSRTEHREAEEERTVEGEEVRSDEDDDAGIDLDFD